MQKKYIFLFLIPILLITGCREEKKKNNKSNVLSDTIEITDNADYICKYDKKDEENKYTIGNKYAIKIEDGVVSNIHSIEIIEANKLELINDFESYINENYDKIKAYGGYEYEIRHENNKLITEVNINFNEFSIETFALNNQEILEYLNEEYKLSEENILKYYEDLGAECKEI